MLACLFSGLSGCGGGGSSSPASPPPGISAPPSPTGLSAVAGDGQVSLKWSASATAVSYAVQRSTTGGGPFTAVATTASLSYADAGLLNGTTYYYEVAAVNSGGSSAYSAAVPP